MPIDARGDYAGGILDLFSPYAMLGGLVVLSMFVTHGAIFLTLKTSGGIRHDASELGNRLAHRHSDTSRRRSELDIASYGDARSATLAIAVVPPRLAQWWRTRVAATASLSSSRPALSSCWSPLTLRCCNPNVMPSTIDPANNLTIANASSSSYTLTVMSWVAVLVVPFVLAY